jgi:hypothetical protein
MVLLVIISEGTVELITRQPTVFKAVIEKVLSPCPLFARESTAP